MDFSALPGGDLVARGLEDLGAGRETAESLLVLIGRPRLALLGITFELPGWAPAIAEHRLYERLAEEDSDSAHGRYNALIRRLVSFERAAACVAP